MAAPDHYATLGLTPFAPAADIKRAFRCLAAEHHPDKNPGDDDAAERFKRIAEAYTALSDVAARAAYDAAISSEPEPVAPAPYLTPSAIHWVARADAPPAPVSVRLCNHGGCHDITEFGPDRTTGTFWHLDGGEIVLRDDALCDFHILPSLASMGPGTHVDQIVFSIDGATAELPIRLELAPAAGRATPSDLASIDAFTALPIPLDTSDNNGLWRMGLGGSLLVMASSAGGLSLPSPTAIHHGSFFIVLHDFSANAAEVIQRYAMPTLIFGGACLLVNLSLAPWRTHALAGAAAILGAATGAASAIVCIAVLAVLLVNLVIWAAMVLVMVAIVFAILVGMGSVMLSG